MADITTGEHAAHPLIKKLFTEMGSPRSIRTTYRMFHGPVGSEEPSSIPMFLELDESELSPTAREALEALEGSAAPGDAWTDFKWKLTAFDRIQDIFDPVFFVTDDDALLMMQQFYFYYEGQRLLRESILCGLNGFAGAANVLLRPFLEFALLQNYFVRSSRSAGSFAPLRRYFATGTTPKTSTFNQEGASGRQLRQTCSRACTRASRGAVRVHRPSLPSRAFRKPTQDDRARTFL